MKQPLSHISIFGALLMTLLSLALLTLGGCKAPGEVTRPRKDWALLCGDACANRPVDVDVGEGTSCVRYEGGAVVCWGIRRGVADQYPIEGRRGPSLGMFAPRPETALVGHALGRDGLPCRARGPGCAELAGPDAVLDAIDVSMSDAHGCVVRRDGSAWCWGTNDAGELAQGLNNFVPSRVPLRLSEPWHRSFTETTETRRVTDVEVGRSICLFLEDSHTAAPSHLVFVSDILAEACESGEETGCLLHEGRMTCRGGWEYGLYGNGTFEPLAGYHDVPGLPEITQMAGGWLHMCALDIDGQVWCWGDNLHGQLGYGALGRDEEGDTFTSPTPTRVPGMDDIVQIAAVGATTCAIRSDGQLFCWGDDYSGVMGSGGAGETTTPMAIPDATDAIDVDIAFLHGCILRRNGETACWGSNSYGGVGPSPEPLGYGRLSRVNDLPRHCPEEGECDWPAIEETEEEE